MERNTNTAGNGKVVCVTGGSGYIASWILKLLLQRGYTVKTTVRKPSNPKKVEHLLKLDGAKERLHLFKADLMEEGSFDSAIKGCHGVFHVASPVILEDVEDPQKEIIDPAVKGTINVLKSCAKTPSVKRVVLTSSMATNLFNGKPRTAEDVVDETWFSLPDICKESQMWYLLSKTLAEDAAWKFAKNNNIDMVCINPGMVAGPLLQPLINFSVTPILNLINGTKTFPNLSYPWVNVKDVAKFHILAYEVASASGRYCLAERVVHFSELSSILSNLYPTLQIANTCENDEPYEATYQVSSEKAKSLGIRFTPLEVTLKETLESFRKNKIFNF